MNRFYYIKYLKPILDIFFSLFLLVVLSPLLIIIALLVLLIDHRPILFRQERLGLDKKKFYIYKFKTMADSDGPLLTFDHDRRITKLGRILRKYKLDELPQLINVLRGEMSLIGPRPEVTVLAKQRYKLNKYLSHLKPGITGLSSIRFIDEEKFLKKSRNHSIYEIYLNDILPEKMAIDEEYFEKVCLLLDCKIAFRTIFVILRTTIK